MSPTRCVAPLVWPLAWQSKQATPRLGFHAAPVLGRVELLLRERRDQQPQPFELLRVQDAVEQLVVVVDRDELALRDVAEVGPRGQVDRRRKLGQEVVGQVEVEIEAGQVAVFLLLDLVDVELREKHAAFGMVRVGQRHETVGKDSLLANAFGSHLGQLVPGHSSLQFDAHATLDRFAARHRYSWGRTVAQIVSFFQER